MILESQVRIPLCDVGAGLSGQTVQTEVPGCPSRFACKRILTTKRHECKAYVSICSLVTGNDVLKNCSCDYMISIIKTLVYSMILLAADSSL
jgi:hypothetical protein